VAVGCATGLGLALAGELGRVLLGQNFHVVLPGRVYRCAQLGPGELERTIKSYGIRTVLNLRGHGPAAEWYHDECRVTARLDVNQEDVAFSASRMPSTSEVRRLIEVLDRTEYPILLHCRQGADRTGLAAAIALLLQGEGDLGLAVRQLSVRYGHFAVGRAGHLDRFLDLYEDWLAEQCRPHDAKVFREWAARAYCPAECRCEFEPLDLPRRVPAGELAPVRMRVHNRGIGPWQMRAESHVGFHLCYVVRNAQERGVASGRAGLFDAVVEPGQSVDLTFALASINEPGRYRVIVDMVDELHCWFHQTGSEPFEWELIVE
jgi:protein tyrosine phosphatase (PTP) superfamily phosphohydrolase (DUF442 family)